MLVYQRVIEDFSVWEGVKAEDMIPTSWFKITGIQKTVNTVNGSRLIIMDEGEINSHNYCTNYFWSEQQFTVG
jgi:hypothetical protein